MLYEQRKLHGSVLLLAQTYVSNLIWLFFTHNNVFLSILRTLDTLEAQILNGFQFTVYACCLLRNVGQISDSVP